MKRTKKLKLIILRQYIEQLVLNGYDITPLLCVPLSRFDFDKMDLAIKELIKEYSYNN